MPDPVIEPTTEPTTEPAGEVSGSGEYYDVSPEQALSGLDRLDREVAYAIKAGRHYPVAIATYRIADVSRLQDPDGSIDLDRESLIGVVVGCHICEQPYNPRMIHNACKGPAR